MDWLNMFSVDDLKTEATRSVIFAHTTRRHTTEVSTLRQHVYVYHYLQS